MAPEDMSGGAPAQVGNALQFVLRQRNAEAGGCVEQARPVPGWDVAVLPPCPDAPLWHAQDLGDGARPAEAAYDLTNGSR